MVMPAGVDAAGDLELQLAQFLGLARGVETLGNALGQRDRAGIGERAIIKAGARDHVFDRVHIGRAKSGGVELAPQRVQVLDLHMRQDDVLRVHDAQFIKRVLLGEARHNADLLARSIARNAAHRFERNDRRDVAVVLVAVGVAVDPQREVGVRSVDGFDAVLECGVSKIFGNARQFRQRWFHALIEQMREFLFDLARVFLLAQLVDEDFDARLVLVVAPAIAVVDAKAGLGVGDELIERHKVADHGRDHGCASHTAAGKEARTDCAVLLNNLNADIVQPHRGAVALRSDHADLELARQVGEFRVKARPLAHQFGVGARIDQFIMRRAGKVIG